MAEIVLGLASSHTPQISMLRSGTSEILNWTTAGGALSGLSPDLLDDIPACRSPAGTGVGTAFTTCNRDRAARTQQETAA